MKSPSATHTQPTADRLFLGSTARRTDINDQTVPAAATIESKRTAERLVGLAFLLVRDRDALRLVALAGRNARLGRVIVIPPTNIEIEGHIEDHGLTLKLKMRLAYSFCCVILQLFQ